MVFVTKDAVVVSVLREKLGDTRTAEEGIADERNTYLIVVYDFIHSAMEEQRRIRLVAVTDHPRI